jgi:glycyl-tRNA synthetase beta chain
LVGIFAIGQKPTGVKDPFGLRRAALGVLRIIIETPLDLDLESMLNLAAEGLSAKVDAVPAVSEVFDYMMDRLKAYYTDRGITADVIDAVLACRPTRPADFDLRVKAVAEFRKLPEAESLSAANKRIRNILKKAKLDIENIWPGYTAAQKAIGSLNNLNVQAQRTMDPHINLNRQIEDALSLLDIELLLESEEQILYREIEDMAKRVEPLFTNQDYEGALKKLAALRESVDGFFDSVMVNCEDEKLRRNRLALLNSLSSLFLSTADLSRLQ